MYAGMKTKLDENTPYVQINPTIGIGTVAKMLAAYSDEAIWQWNLQVQDWIVFPCELEFLSSSGDLSRGGSILDVAWGWGTPAVSHLRDFPKFETTEIGVSLRYLFSGKSKAKKILGDIRQVVDGKSFTCIRLALVAQHIRHHGVLLEGLKPFLDERGRLFIIESRDELLEFYPGLPRLREMYCRLSELQKTTGGLRSASQKMKARASVFGFRPVASVKRPILAKTELQRLQFFRMFCIHVELLSRSFQGKFDRPGLLAEVFEWYREPESTAQIGVHFLMLEKIKKRGIRRVVDS
jgi:hypothetical protein